jgi:hypothetical protein
MKPYLLFEKKSYALQKNLPQNSKVLTQDLELNTLWKYMAHEDEFLFEVVKDVTLSGLFIDIGTILYRLDILRDCLKNRTLIRKIYNLAIEGIESEKKRWYLAFTNHPYYLLSDSVDKLQSYVDILKKFKNISDKHANKF